MAARRYGPLKVSPGGNGVTLTLTNSTGKVLSSIYVSKSQNLHVIGHLDIQELLAGRLGRIIRKVKSMW